MAIVSGDLSWRLSTTAGSAGNTTAQGAPASSLGKYISTTVLAAGLNGLFPDVSGAENASSQVDYLCVFARNAHATLPLTNAVAWLDGGDPAGGVNVAIAVDSTAASAVGSSSAQALTASSRTAPGGSVTGLTYSTPTSYATGVSLGSIPAGQCRAVWIRRTATNSAPVDGEEITLTLTGDTAA